MMNKIDFISMSLPYELWGLDTVDNNMWPIRFDKGCPECVCELLGHEKYKSRCINGFQAAHDKMILPIVHPLSDIDKEIEHNGEKFIPLEKLGYSRNNKISFLFQSNIKGEGVRLHHLMKLLEWHFDVADLISKNEAIDVNKLYNPYK